MSSSKNTTEDYRSIDVRWLKRQGMLSPGAIRIVTWSWPGGAFATLSVRAEQDRVVLSHRHNDGSSGWEDAEYPVNLVTTPCRLGGDRHWFLCPARGCNQRVAVLYGGNIFACRTCHDLAYPSQRETHGDRAARRALRIRSRLGWPGGILQGSGLGKPKGMHWRTYDRLCGEHEVMERVLVNALASRFGLNCRKD